MMLGGGFLKQAQDSFEKNRQLRKAAVKGRLDAHQISVRIGASIDPKHYDLSNSERSKIVARARFESRKELFAMITVIAMTGVIFSVVIFYIFG